MTAPLQVDATQQVRKRRPRAAFRKALERLGSGETLLVDYSSTRKTSFAMTMAIKRRIIGKHFVFRRANASQFYVWIGTAAERSGGMRSVIPVPESELRRVTA